MSDLSAKPTAASIPDDPDAGRNYSVAYDLRITAAVYRRGAITIWMTWNLHTGRPCMVLTPSDPGLSHEKVIPCIVPMDRAFLWDEYTGDFAAISETLFGFCCALNVDPHRGSMALLSVIRDYLEELIRMPPKPLWDMKPVADVITIDHATGAETHKEVIDHA
jgi:hypothetical protein